jgi:hypothetical protein
MRVADPFVGSLPHDADVVVGIDEGTACCVAACGRALSLWTRRAGDRTQHQEPAKVGLKKKITIGPVATCPFLCVSRTRCASVPIFPFVFSLFFVRSGSIQRLFFSYVEP